MATGGALLTLLGMGGQIASGLVAQNEAESAASRARRRARSTSSLVASEINPLANPLIALIVSQSLARFGMVDPSIVQQAGPIGRTIEAIRAAGLTGAEQFGAIALIRDLQEGMSSGRYTPEQAEEAFRANFSHQFIRQFGGFETFGELLQADAAYQQQAQAQLQQLNQIAQLSGGRQAAVEAALSQVTQQASQLADFDSILAAERGRLERSFGDERTRILSAANFGGFNPAATLQELERGRQDLDLLALERAAGLSNARTGSLGNAAALIAALDPTAPVTQMNLAQFLPQTGGIANQSVNDIAAQLEAAGGLAAAQAALGVSAQTTQMGLGALGAAGGGNLGISGGLSQLGPYGTGAFAPGTS